MKLQYIIIFLGMPHQIPQAVTGRSGQLFGHATYDVKLRAHVFKFDGDKWEKVGQDICNGLKRRSCRWLVAAEIIPDHAAPETQLAEELDRVTALLAQVTAERDTAQANAAALLARVIGLEQGAAPAAPIEPAPEFEKPLEAQQATMAPPAPALPPLKEMGYRDLRKIAQAVNERRPNTIALNPAPKQGELLAALLAVPDLAELIPSEAA